jgi:hypothetical protein
MSYFCNLQTSLSKNKTNNISRKKQFLPQRDSKEQSELSRELQIVNDVLNSPGQPFDQEVLTLMEKRFGYDFSRVRVHTDAKAAESARAVNAIAYTVGKDMVFGAGQYSPSSTAGKHLLAHELTHVVQQNDRSYRSKTRLEIKPEASIWEYEAEHASNTFDQCDSVDAVPSINKISLSPFVVARQRLISSDNNELQRARSQQTATSRRSERLTPRSRVLLIDLQLDEVPARIDNSRSIDQITEQFYNIPITLIPPNTSVQSGPILTSGKYGCSIRRYGLTSDDFSLSFNLDNSNIQSSSRPFNITSESGLSTTECWANHVEFQARLRQTIYLPNDLETHPCLQSEDPRQFRRETLEHERLHESDNSQAVHETLRLLRERLAFTIGIGSQIPMVRITSDPEGFIQDCTNKLHESLERLSSDHEIVYRRLSAEYASVLDPHDRELHELKLRLLEEAHERASTLQP